MSKLPLDDPKTGTHRARLWEIGCYALNNTSTNAYMILVASISYFLVGIVGVGAVLAGSLVTIMRIWDGVTDPFIGMLVDNTNTKFGKNRPFIVIGNVILFVMTFVMFRFIPKIPSGGRLIAFIIMYAIYIIGYTFQCVVTKSAQTCLTNRYNRFLGTARRMLPAESVPDYDSWFELSEGGTLKAAAILRKLRKL